MSTFHYPREGVQFYTFQYIQIIGHNTVAAQALNIFYLIYSNPEWTIYICLLPQTWTYNFINIHFHSQFYGHHCCCWSPAWGCNDDYSHCVHHTQNPGCGFHFHGLETSRSLHSFDPWRSSCLCPCTLIRSTSKGVSPQRLQASLSSCFAYKIKIWKHYINHLVEKKNLDNKILGIFLPF